MKYRLVAVVVAVSAFIWGAPEFALAQVTRVDYRVVYAPANEIGRRLDDAGRDGFACSAVARPEPDARVPGVVVLLSRVVGAGPQGVVHRVVVGDDGGAKLQPLLDQAGTDGFRLCGIALDDGGTTSSLIAIMHRRLERAAPQWRYRVEPVADLQNSASRLNTAGRDGFQPVAAAQVRNGGSAETRRWVIVAERPVEGRPPTEVVLRSSSTLDGVRRVLLEQAGQGYHLEQLWNAGSDVVALMTRSIAARTAPSAYDVDAADVYGFRALSRLYVADVPFLSPGRRLVVTDRSASASTEVVEDPLPAFGSVGLSEASSLSALSDHISRNRDYVVVSVTVRRGDRSPFVLRTVLSRHRP